MKKLWSEFKAFINKGNVIDMAVGVVVATAFGKITSSLVADIIMPLVGILTGGKDFSALTIVLKEAYIDSNGVEVAANELRYGLFIQQIINFLIIALAVFVFIKVLTTAGEKAKKLREKGQTPVDVVVEEEPAPAPEPTAEEKLLTEIRDLLKENK